VNNKTVILYLNKPEQEKWKWTENRWNKDIDNLFATEGISPQIVVHRWHSYHTEDTIKQINEDAQLVFLGSCGWFQNISSTLDKSSNAHIISTKWTGTMLVNDPLFKIINEELLNQNDKIVWWKIWKKADWKLKNNENWEWYVRPDKNAWTLMIRKYNELKSKQQI
jgi:hypothetical protein